MGLDGWMLSLHPAIISYSLLCFFERSQLKQVKLASSKDLERSGKSIRE